MLHSFLNHSNIDMNGEYKEKIQCILKSLLSERINGN